MNQQQITDEVKRLAKEIAKYWRMEIYKGCWVKIGGKIQLVSNCNNNYFYTGCNYVKNQWTNRKGSGIPIPDIGDCLEKLRELGGWWNIIVDINSGKEVFEWGNKKQGLGSIPYKDDSDFYFLLLSAVLEVLKERANEEKTYWEQKKREQQKENEHHLKMVKETDGKEK